MIQLPHPYVTTGKTMALTVWTFVSKVMSLLFNTLSRFVIAFLPRSKCLLISWLQSPSAVILELPKIKSATVSPSICHEVMGPDTNKWLSEEPLQTAVKRREAKSKGEKIYPFECRVPKEGWLVVYFEVRPGSLSSELVGLHFVC